MNISILILTLLGILSDLIEFTYDCGQFTRQHILPVVVWVCLWSYDQTNLLWDKMTSVDMKLNVHRTPLTTGFAY
jgi:hypothetical protein